MAFAPVFRPWAAARCWPIAAPRAASVFPPEPSLVRGGGMAQLDEGSAPLPPDLPRLERLKKRREFLRAASRGKRAARPGLVLQALAIPEPSLRLGFTVTKKIGNAVIRNRARRRLKEAARLTLPAMGLSGWDLVLIGRDATAERPFPLLIEDLRAALRQAGVAP